MAECELPQDCPDCRTAAPRVILTAPNLFGMTAERRRAYATNERSAHAPKTLGDMKASHGADCACCSGKSARMSRRGKDGLRVMP